MFARDRPAVPAGRAARRATVSVDVVLLTPHGRRLAVLLRRSPDPHGRERWELPWDSLHGGEALGMAAARIAGRALGATPALLEQIAAFGDGRRHPGGATVSVAFLALAPAGSGSPAGAETAWHSAEDLRGIPPAQRAMVDGALTAMRARLAYSPIAFRLLPPAFTLSQLQEVYELLLGRRLHKASFRRALHAAALVEPTDEWRSEGRGRPAQLYRYAPRKRRAKQRGVRFDGLGG